MKVVGATVKQQGERSVATKAEPGSRPGTPNRTRTRTATRTRILIIDHDSVARAVVVAVLGNQYECEEAAGVAEARIILSQSEFQLVLCAIHMPVESGWILAEEIFAGNTHTSIVFMTEEDDLELAQKAFELGVHGYLVKPYKRSQLLINVMNALKRRELEIAQANHQHALRQQLQTVIDNAPLRIYVKDRAYRFIAINRAASQDLGRTPEELIGHTVGEFLSPTEAARSRAGDSQVLSERGVHEAEETLTRGGKTRHMLTSKFPLVDDDGLVYAVCGISADVTASKDAQRLGEELVATQRRAIEELRASRQESIERLARTVELRDTETGEHVNRMARIAAFLGQTLGLDDEHVDELLVAAPMHDVGKIGIADEVILKPGPLNAEERSDMERHTTIGHDLLVDSDSEVLQTAARIALTHHERWDGGGYPRGLEAEAIPLEGRIAAVADVFDALLSDRPYRAAMSLDETVGIMAKGAGRHFDPAVTEALLEHLDEVLQLRS